jgi:hypothetical protein
MRSSATSARSAAAATSAPADARAGARLPTSTGGRVACSAARGRRGGDGRASTVAADAASPGHQLVRVEHVDGPCRGRPDHQRARRERPGRPGGALHRPRGACAVRARRREARRACRDVRVRPAGREACRVRGGAGDDAGRARRRAGAAVRAARLGDVGADRAALRGGKVRGGGRARPRAARALSRRAAPPLQPRVLRGARRAQGRGPGAPAEGAESSERLRRGAARDDDFASLRDDPGFRAIIGA